MTNFEILKREIIECLIRAESKEAIQVLNHLQEFAEGLGDGWISVDDLPPNGTECFVLVGEYDLKGANPDFVGYVSYKNRYFNRIDKTIYKDDHFLCDEKSHVKVTHWLPLPKDPKEY